MAPRSSRQQQLEIIILEKDETVILAQVHLPLLPSSTPLNKYL
jgi:hypothetical protein